MKPALAIWIALSATMFVQGQQSHNKNNKTPGGQAPFTAYLFAYFTGNSKSDEAIRFALSKDGYHYTALNSNKPIIPSAQIS